VKRYQKRIAQLVCALVGVTATSCFLPVLAFAEEHAAEASHDSGGGGLSLLLPNALEFIPMLISFLFLFIVLSKLAWPMIIGMLNNRVETIKGNMDAAEESRVETARLLEEQRVLLNEARTQASQILNEARVTAEANRVEIEAQAARQAEIVLARARETIENEKNQAMLELRQSVADLTVTLAGRLIGNDLNEMEHRRIIEYYVTQAGNLDAN
jgi:F-type H+-transporting ATPase subunit b